MKLATYDDGSRDGQLVVVSRDLSSAHYATHISTRLQQVLDDWNFLAPQLQDLAQTLDHGKARHAFAFEPARCRAPLPRAPYWAEVQAYKGVESASSGAALVPGRVQHLPGDGGWAAKVHAEFADTATGLDIAPGWAVITGDVAMGQAPAQSLEGVRLLMGVLGWHAVAPAPTTSKGRSSVQAQMGAGQRLPLACSAVVVTPDELGEGWAGGKPRLKAQVSIDGLPWAEADVAADLALHAGQWLACLSRHRDLRAGSIVSSGALAGPDGGLSLAARRAAADQAGVR